MKFLTPGEKIKKMRKQFNMIQQDFEEEFMTRSYYGMIEAGKRNINEKIATSIAEKFTKKAKSLGVDLHVSPEYLMMSPQEEARQYCKDKLSLDLKEEEIYDVLSIAKEYDIPEIEMEAYKKVGLIYHSNYRYLDAFIAFNNALDIAKNIDEKQGQAYLFNKLGACKYANMEYIEALVYFEKANSYASIYNVEKIEKKAILNIAMCYVKLNRINSAIDYVDMFLLRFKEDLDVNEYIYANMIKVNCYSDREDYNNAIELSTKLLFELEDQEGSIAAFIYNNIGIFYTKKGEMNKSLEYFNNSQLIRKDKEPEMLSHTIIEKAQAYIKQDLYIEAEMLLQLGIDMTIKYNDQEYLLKGYFNLIEVYNAVKDYKNVEKTYFKIEAILKEKTNKNELLKLYLDIVEFYAQQENLVKIKEYIDLSQKTIAKCH
jgi:tetratricopeptide (TPR) repeat protein